MSKRRGTGGYRGPENPLPPTCQQVPKVVPTKPQAEATQPDAIMQMRLHVLEARVAALEAAHIVTFSSGGEGGDDE